MVIGYIIQCWNSYCICIISHQTTGFSKSYNNPKGQLIGVDPAKTAMAIAYSDSYNNIIQPFWALPALGIAKLGQDILWVHFNRLITTGIIIGVGYYSYRILVYKFIIITYYLL
ncbi:TIGR00366 family protein [uncultured Brachyspira sp.]|uniref:TIGR00366 family protein n=1 Tax=uncultured Brachyspira sp. TaxID=221953 RepID=UPI002638C035|nr:TIGR00366 family protein [uncultured Brachyspira sp.]